MDETYIKVKGHWKYLYRAVDKDGNTVDCLLTAKRDRIAANRFLFKAIKLNNEPIKINIDKSGANTAAINDYSDDEGTDIEIRQNKYLNTMIEQDHGPIKQLCRATLGFKSFKSARITIGGFESMRIIRKRQVKVEGNTSAEIFYSMAACYLAKPATLLLRAGKRNKARSVEINILFIHQKAISDQNLFDVNFGYASDFLSLLWFLLGFGAFAPTGLFKFAAKIVVQRLQIRKGKTSRSV